ncbi:MAG: dihydrodipicolinate synthase family protein [Phycisphaerae bacterium]|nr:dihydrodipicolinate synthase family protein [Phycisphaerae bacterium]
MTITEVHAVLKRGLVIPAHPLALTAARRLDERRQRALSRYYLAAGSGGLAIGVHTTQFAIRDPKIGLYRPVLELGMEVIREQPTRDGVPVLGIAGVCGRTEQAVSEARLAAEFGYHAGLLSLGAMAAEGDDALIAHCQTIAEVIPLVGFYLQPSVGGRVLGFDFWRRFADIDNVVAIKIAPFNRYQTLDVVRAVAETGRAREIALYTGNDDNIVVDLLTRYRFADEAGPVELRIVGGLLGHWSVWTQRAVELVGEIHRVVESGDAVPPALLTRAVEVTDSNAAFFDLAHGFAGCIAGLHEVLRRQGLLAGRWCLDPDEDLSPGQMAEIDRVYRAYPHLADDAFIAAHLDEWLR